MLQDPRATRSKPLGRGLLMVRIRMLAGQPPLASRTCGTMKTPQSRTARAAASGARSTTAAVKRSSADALPVIVVNQSFCDIGMVAAATALH